MKTYDIPVISGDGIGPEIIREGKKVIDAAAELNNFKVNWLEYSFGAEHYLKTGETISNNQLRELENYKVIYLGAFGDPRVKPGILESGLLIKIRNHLDQYINYRPVKLMEGVQTPLRNINSEDLDIIFIRENIEDFYIGLGDRASKGHSKKKFVIERKIYQAEFNVEMKTNAGEAAYNLGFISRKNTERIMDYGFKLANKLGKKRVTCVDKMNVIPEMYGLWRDVANETAKNYPDIELEFNFADALNMWLVKKPSHFDIVICPNLFGDIITDLGAMISGGLGLAYGGNLNPEGTSMFEPIHGSAPKYKDKNIVNPCATILAGALMIESLGENSAAKMIKNAVQKTIKKGNVLTKDLGGESTTSKMGDEIAKNL